MIDVRSSIAVLCSIFSISLFDTSLSFLTISLLVTYRSCKAKIKRILLLVLVVDFIPLITKINFIFIEYMLIHCYVSFVVANISSEYVGTSTLASVLLRYTPWMKINDFVTLLGSLSQEIEFSLVAHLFSI